MKTETELLAKFAAALDSDTGAKARLENAADEITFIKVLGEIAREKGFDLGDTDLLSILGQQASTETELSDSHLGSIVGGSDSKQAVEAARDRKKAGLDNIQKFLDIMRSMNVNI